MIMDTLDTLFRSLDVRGAAPGKFLGSDLGLDFEERLYIREDIEERLNVVLQDDELKPDLTLLELAGLVARKLLATPPQASFEGKLIEDIVIAAPAETVRHALLDVVAWPGRLSYVRDARLTYDDGMHQEFAMDLDDGLGRTVSIRSVRRCEADHIAYFQPQPACFLKHHCGDWFIRPLTPAATHLTLTKRWTRSAKAETLLPARHGMTSAQRVAALLRAQASGALTAWQRCLEQP